MFCSYYRVVVDSANEDLTIRFQETAGEQFMVSLVQYGRKPTQTSYIFYKYPSDPDGMAQYYRVQPRIGIYYLMVHFFPPLYSGPVLIHQYTIETLVDNVTPFGYKSLNGAKSFIVAPPKFYAREGYPVPAAWDMVRPVASASQPVTIRVERTTLFRFQGSEWVYVRFLVSTLSASFTVTATVLSPGLEITVVVQRSIKPTLAMYLESDDTADSDRRYAVTVNKPITGAFYYVGIYSRKRSLTVTSSLEEEELAAADVSLRISYKPGQPLLPPVTRLTSYFVYFDFAPSLSYKYYRIDVPSDRRDVVILVTHLDDGITDIIVSNDDPWPNNAKYAPSKQGQGWWRSESATGGGRLLHIKNFELGYKSPATYYIAVYAVKRVNFFILARLDRPPNNLRVDSVNKGQVAPSAFTHYRFVPGLPVVSFMYVVVKQAPPFTYGLQIFLKQFDVPTLIDYDSKTDVSDANGNYVLAIARPQPDALIYVGVFGRDLQLLQPGDNYYFSIEVMTDLKFKNYESSPYVGNIGTSSAGYTPPLPGTYEETLPETPVNITIANNGTLYFHRLEIAEPTTVTVAAASNNTFLSLYARQLFFPQLNSTFRGVLGLDVGNGELIYQVCGQALQPNLTHRSCGRAPFVSMTLDPATLLPDSHMFYLAVYAPGCVNRTNGTAVCPATVSYTLQATRQSRAPPRIVDLASNIQTDTASLSMPHASRRIYRRLFTGNTSLLFSITSIQRGSINMLLSTSLDTLSPVFPLPANWRADNVSINSPIALHPDDPAAPPSGTHVYLSIYSGGNATYTLTFTAWPFAPSLQPAKQYSGTVSSPTYVGLFQGWSRAYFRIEPDALQGRVGRVTVIPTGTVCNGVPCTQRECCDNTNPFFHFDIMVKRGTPPSVTNPADFDQSMSIVTGPNSKCGNTAPCVIGSSTNLCESTCASPDPRVSPRCCSMFTEYVITVKSDQVRPIYVAVQGRTPVTQRRTNTFFVRLDLTEAETASDGPPADTSPLRYAPQETCSSVSRPSSAPSAPILQDLRVGESMAGVLQFGSWRLYTWMPPAAGRLTVVLRQSIGLFGMRILAQREALPSLQAHAISSTWMSPQQSQCDLATSVGSQACAKCSGDSCICDGSDCVIEASNAATLGSENAQGGPLQGSTATVRIRVYPRKNVTIAVLAESQVYSPYAYSIESSFQLTSVASQIFPCTNVSMQGSITAKVGMRGYAMYRTPRVPLGHDLTVTVAATYTRSIGACQWGSNDGTGCEYVPAVETWTGMADRVWNNISSVCVGCFFDHGFNYPGGIMRKIYFVATAGIVGFPAPRCLINQVWRDYFSVTYSRLHPFLTIITNATDPFALCETQLVPLPHPVLVPTPMENYTAASPDECCARCKAEPTCSFWTFTRETSALCWVCIDENLRFEELEVAPRNNVTFLDANRTQWRTQTPLTIVRGPRCTVRLAPCCILRNHTIGERDRARVTASQAVTSGSFGRCSSTPNGHVEVYVANKLNCSDVTRSNLAKIQWTGGATASVNDGDGRQTWDTAATLGKKQICLEYWNGRTVLGSVVSDEPELAQCVRWSNRTLSLATQDEMSRTLCLGVRVTPYTWIASRGVVLRNQTAPYVVVSSAQFQLHPCTVEVFKTAFNISDPTRTAVYLDVSAPTQITLREWVVSVPSGINTTLQLSEARTPASQGSAPLCLSVSSADQRTGVLAACSSGFNTWSLEGPSLVYANDRTCLSALLACSRYLTEWNDGCTASATQPPQLAPCFTARQLQPRVVASHSDPAFEPSEHIISVHGVLPSNYTLTWDISPAAPAIVSGQLYAGVLSSASSRPSCFKFRGQALGEMYQAVVHGGAGHVVSVRTGWCGLSAQANATVRSRSGAYAILLPPLAQAVSEAALSMERCVCIGVANASQLVFPAKFWIQIWLSSMQEKDWIIPGGSESNGAVSQDHVNANNNTEDVVLLIPIAGESVEIARTQDHAQSVRWQVLVREAVVVNVSLVDSCEACACEGCSARLSVGDALGMQFTDAVSLDQERNHVSLWLYPADGQARSIQVSANFSNSTRNASTIRISVYVTLERLVTEAAPVTTLLQAAPLHVELARYAGAQRSAAVRVTAPLQYYTIVTVRTFGGDADVLMAYGEFVPARTQPTSAHMTAGFLRSDAVNGNPDMVVWVDSNRQDTFQPGVYTMGVYADTHTNVTLSLSLVPLPVTIAYGRTVRISLLPSATRFLRLEYDVLAAPQLLFEADLVPGYNISECPCTLLVRDSLPPTQKYVSSWAHGPPIRHSTARRSAEALVVALSRCPAGYIGNGTACEGLASVCDDVAVASGNCSVTISYANVTEAECAYEMRVTTL